MTTSDLGYKIVGARMSNRRRPAFSRYIGIDYSGAETAEASLKGLRVYMADRESLPVEVPPPPSPRWYWSRSEIAEIEGWILGVPPEPVATEASRSTAKARRPTQLAVKRLGRHEDLASKYTYRVSWSDGDREYVVH